MGVRAILPPDLQTANRNPTVSDNKYVVGTLWLNKSASSTWMFTGTGGWIELGSAAAEPLNSLTGSSGGPITPASGNITLAAGTGMLSTVGTAGTITFNVNFASPPDLGSTTPAAVTGTTVNSTGSMTAGTSLTATLGDITATNGNIVRGTEGNKDIYTSVATTTLAGSNSAGSVVLVGGSAPISTTAVTANSLIRLTRQSIGATGAAALGILTVGTITPSLSFVINSVQPADATLLQASDVSVVFWEIVN